MRGKHSFGAEKRRMSDTALVLTLLTVGGAIYLISFLWIATVGARESHANEPPPHAGEPSRHH
ncbi:MAG: hypothetical protein DLM53_12715 [Candidatus Eremiobacter antarcticus]|nr:MAG: hypothetical protein DLM53_12715 [Candidatus Eremiobacter sp. RRmetagenome_bin22]